jgi:uncharacterized membrane-anchored protein YhcB (DUF1043 family)
MTIAISFIVGVMVGFTIGFLVFRNNAKKIQEAEKTVVDIASKFKNGEKE